MADEVKKNWYESKTLWVNAIAAVALVGQGINGNFVIPAEIQATALTVINLVLRIITKKEVIW